MSQDEQNANGDGGEDIEAFLKSLEEADLSDLPSSRAPDASKAAAKPVATAPDTTELDARFAALDDLVPDELPATQKKAPADDKKGKKNDGEKKSRKERAAEKKAAKAAAKQQKLDAKAAARQQKLDAKAAQPAWKRFAKASAKVALMSLPMVIFVWILGAFLAHVISAGWLIALLAILVGVGIPLLAATISKRGKATWWAAGLGVLLTVLLVAPMPKTVGSALTHYGYWPTAVVGEIAKWEVDNSLNGIGAAVAGAFGSALGMDVAGAMKLGTMDRVDGSVMPETPATPPTEAGADSANPDSPQPAPEAAPTAE